MAGPLNVVKVPLREASIEVRFPGDARIDSFRGVFQQRVRHRFPHLLVPLVKPDEPAALRPYRFESSSQTSSVSLGLSSFGLSMQDYPGWSSFRQQALELWGLVADTIEPARITRLGARYVNHFDEELVPRLDLSAPPPYLAWLPHDPSFHHGITLLEDGPRGMLVRVERPRGTCELVVDLDSFCTDLEPGDIPEELDQLHTRLEREFLQVLEPRFRETLARCAERGAAEGQ